MAKQQPKSKPTSFTLRKRISSAKSKEFLILSNFGEGYRNREDITKLPPGIMVIGSQNVMTNVDGGISIRKGFMLDGQAAPTPSFLLQQNGFLILQQDGSLIEVT